MKKLINKFKESMLRAQIAATNFLNEERGDTNFISIAIILIVIIAIAVVFIGFKDQILSKLNTAIQDLLNAL